MDAAESDEERVANRRAWQAGVRHDGIGCAARGGIWPGDWVGVEPVRP
jgi:hypothetical protein